MPTNGNDILRVGAGQEIYGLGGRAYTITDTSAGTLLTAGQDSILLTGIHDFEV